MTVLAASSEEGFFSDIQSDNYDPSAIGLCLSGGGYRATLFHTGVIIRLNELGLLSRLARISSVSGGSITNGILAMNWDKLGFRNAGDIASDDAIRKALIQPVLELTGQTLDVSGGLLGLLPWNSAGNVLAGKYDDIMFKGLKLRDLSRSPTAPMFIFNATNLQTGGRFEFTRDHLADSRALYLEDHQALVSEAVAASSAFPPVLSPLRLDLRGQNVPKSSFVEAGSVNDDPELRKRPVLIDGGVYDNLGLEGIWKDCGVLIASYSGFNNKPQPVNFNLDHLMTTINIFLASSIDWRERMLISLFENKLSDDLPERQGTYWTAETDIAAYSKHAPWDPKDPIFAAAVASPTRLKALEHKDQAPVIQAGYAFCDAGVRTHVMENAPAPGGLPVI
jgi:NTE family protein